MYMRLNTIPPGDRWNIRLRRFFTDERKETIVFYLKVEIVTFSVMCAYDNIQQHFQEDEPLVNLLTIPISIAIIAFVFHMSLKMRFISIVIAFNLVIYIFYPYLFLRENSAPPLVRTIMMSTDNEQAKCRRTQILPNWNVDEIVLGVTKFQNF